MEKRPYDPIPEEEPELPEETMLTAASAGEMTGLIPSGRPDHEQRESYQDVLPWLPPFAAPQI